MPNEKIIQQKQLENTLFLLSEIENGDSVSQRSISVRLGVALGLTNALVKRCIKKGLIKAKQVPARRYAYYLTPKGFREKSRLTAEYLNQSLVFYRQAKSQYASLFDICAKRGWKNIALFGASELTEIASLAAIEAGVELVGVVDQKRNSHQYCGLPLIPGLNNISDGNPLDAVIITDLINPQEALDLMLKSIDGDRVLTPDFLYVSRQKSDDLDSDEEGPSLAPPDRG